MTEFTIRSGHPDDWQTIADFNRALARETEAKELDRETIEAGVRAVLGDRGKGAYHVAIAGGRIVGQLMTTLEWSDWRNGWFHWIQSVYVEPDFRGKGVFRKLYETAEQLAREDGSVCGLRLYVENENDRAQEVYLRLGMSRTHYQLFEVEF